MRPHGWGGPGGAAAGGPQPWRSHFTGSRVEVAWAPESGLRRAPPAPERRLYTSVPHLQDGPPNPAVLRWGPHTTIPVMGTRRGRDRRAQGAKRAGRRAAPPNAPCWIAAPALRPPASQLDPLTLFQIHGRKVLLPAPHFHLAAKTPEAGSLGVPQRVLVLEMERRCIITL